MVAATYVERPRHLRLVTAEEFEPRGRARAVAAAGAGSGAGAASDLTYLRRRLVAVGLVVLLLLGIGLALGRAGSQRAGVVSGSVGSVGTVIGSGADAADALPIAQREYVVQPGDTLWKIARALQPEGDVRPLVYELGKSRNGAPLRAGERIRMP